MKLTPSNYGTLPVEPFSLAPNVEPPKVRPQDWFGIARNICHDSLTQAQAGSIMREVREIPELRQITEPIAQLSSETMAECRAAWKRLEGGR